MGGDADKVKDKTKYIEQEYEKYITDSYVVNGEGDRVEGAAAFGLLDKLKDEYAKPQAERQLPVFVARLDDGTVLNVLAVYGAGLLGTDMGIYRPRKRLGYHPRCGFRPSGRDSRTRCGNHHSRIFRTVHRQDHIRRRGVYRNSGAQRGRRSAGNDHAVDAISGGTITSRGVESMLRNCLEAYLPLIRKQQAAAAQPELKQVSLTDITVENHE